MDQTGDDLKKDLDELKIKYKKLKVLLYIYFSYWRTQHKLRKPK